jgi:hypothetical protein
VLHICICSFAFHVELWVVRIRIVVHSSYSTCHLKFCHWCWIWLRFALNFFIVGTFVAMAPPLIAPRNFKHKFFFLFNHLLINLSYIASTSQNFKLDVVNPFQVELDLINNKKRKKMYGMNCCFQNSWAMKFSCAKSVVCIDINVIYVKCKVYIIFEGWNKLLVA